MVLMLIMFGVCCIFWDFSGRQELIQSRLIRGVSSPLVGGDGGLRHPDYHSNSWYHAMLMSVRGLGVVNGCYVCSALPHFAHSSVPLTPLPLTGAETLGVLVAFTVGVGGAVRDAEGNLRVASVVSMLRTCNVSIPDYSGAVIRVTNVSSQIKDLRAFSSGSWSSVLLRVLIPFMFVLIMLLMNDTANV